MRKLIAAAAMLLGVGAPVAAQDETGFQAFLEQVRQQALREGVSARTLDQVLPTLSLNPRVVELDRAQPGGNPAAPPSASIPAFAPYRVKHVDRARIDRGRAKYQALRPLLSRVEAQTGVPEEIMVAIWGHETNYGSYTGDFDLPRSLASLAYEGRRRELFTKELIATFKMMDRGVPRDRLKGSWAGATGYPQFLPSIYLRLARDGDADGRVDIWTSEADALASIANYFVSAGWRPGRPWGVAASVPPYLDRTSVAGKVTSPRCPRVHERHTRWMTVAEWRARGVVQAGGARLRDAELVTLLEPDGPGATAYLLTSNYRAILDYNCSNFYALSVGLLADEVAQAS
ncbi:lytic murein transglycosylase [Sphingomonas sp. ID1715]|uniref:lytic murein transglycosylase n=1 Tax=Sphingomonas sp. ID1715 TaxID=1656898 RepID=UPI00148911F8|nr:lytic murein transglycosylase [Sphingomonas sp. ID1715]NNM75420.1 lytic murein transglycosylase [Sphingomonas sp. ID1715]